MLGGGSRRGQTASGSAVLIAIIAGFLLLYILFLPPAERDQLLFGGDGGFGGQSWSGGGSGGGSFTQYGPVLVLTETPGTLRFLRSPIQEHNIPTSTIFTRINTQVVKSIDSGIVKNGIFAKKDMSIPFTPGKEGSGNYLLSFSLEEAGSGPLRILINGNQIYERPIREPSPPPIQLPTDYFVEGENVITLQTDDTGLAFWQPNAYKLRNIQISADVIDQSGSVSEQTFSVSEEEIGAFRAAQLEFIPDCDPSNAGRLVVHLNDRLVRDSDNNTFTVPNILYTGLVDCGVRFKTDVPKEYLRVGENRLFMAAVQGGQYVVDNIKLTLEMRQSDYPVYYFNLPMEMYEGIDLGYGQLVLTMTFTDYRNVKSGEVVVNGFVQSFSTQDYVWQAVIDPGIINPGPNTIQIAPHVDRLDVAELKLEIV